MISVKGLVSLHRYRIPLELWYSNPEDHTGPAEWTPPETRNRLQQMSREGGRAEALRYSVSLQCNDVDELASAGLLCRLTR